MDKQEVLERCRRDNVAFVRLQFTEPYGAVKNVSIPVEELEKALDNELMFDGSSIRGFKGSSSRTCISCPTRRPTRCCHGAARAT
jgi:glutamine synthetase